MNRGIALLLCAQVFLIMCQRGDDSVDKGVVALKQGNTQVAITLFEEAFAKGNQRAARELALVYGIGIGIEADESRAVRYLETLTPEQEKRTALIIAVELEEGTLGKKDLEAAERWKDRAALE